jgi:TolA-binding protein
VNKKRSIELKKVCPSFLTQFGYRFICLTTGLTLTFGTVGTLGCSTSSKRLSPEEVETKEVETKEVQAAPNETAHAQENQGRRSQIQSLQDPTAQKLLAEMSQKLEAMETKLLGMNDKLEATRIEMDLIKREKSFSSAEVFDHPSATTGNPIDELETAQDFETRFTGFTNDTLTQLYRRAMIFYLAEKYPESILAFSEFIEKAPDHPLAGSAQFYVGESYFQQKEYRLALQEYHRVLTSYDRSPHVPDTLARMVIAEESLKKTDAAEGHRHLLTSLFPTSPAAGTINDPEHGIAEQSKPEPSTPEKSVPKKNSLEVEKPIILDPVSTHHNEQTEAPSVEAMKETPPTADSLPPQ